MLNKYSFIDEAEKKEKINYKSHPKYQKYFKMLMCGVPKEAVKHKMSLDNLDPNVLDNPDGTSLQKTPESNLNNLLGTRKSDKPKFNIKEQIKLAKLQKQTQKQKDEDSKQNTKPPNNGFKPPSLDEILKMKEMTKKKKANKETI